MTLEININIYNVCDFLLSSSVLSRQINTVHLNLPQHSFLFFNFLWFHILIFRISGIYSTHVNDEPTNSDIVIPRKVKYNGDLISHNVTHHHSDDNEELHYRLNFEGTEYHLQLTAISNFISPGMIVERRKRNIHVRTSARDRATKCHYRGFIRGHANSLVALSACDGLVSIYYIATSW